jgi:hypothetical protein
MGTSQIVLDGILHVVSDEAIIIIKRNERRFWTRSLAREDAEATLCKRMVDFKPGDEGRDLMARRFIPSFPKLWQQHEDIYVTIFCAALQRLSENPGDTNHENIISERLCPILNALCFDE